MRYFAIYKTLLRFNFAELIAYRGNFINGIVANSVWGFFSVVLIVVLTSRTPFIFGWSRGELFLLFGIYNIFTSVFQFFFTRGFERFAETVHLGSLDSVLLKPIDSQFLMSFTYINIPVILRVVIGVIFCKYALSLMNYVPSIQDLGLSIFLMTISITVLYSIWYIVATCLIWWSSLSNLVGLLYEMNGTTRYPQQMFRSASPFLFYAIFPLTLVSTTPTLALIGKVTLGNIFWLVIFATAFLAASRIFWRFSLKYYSSASG